MSENAALSGPDRASNDEEVVSDNSFETNHHQAGTLPCRSLENIENYVEDDARQRFRALRQSVISGAVKRVAYEATGDLWEFIDEMFKQ